MALYVACITGIVIWTMICGLPILGGVIEVLTQGGGAADLALTIILARWALVVIPLSLFAMLAKPAAEVEAPQPAARPPVPPADDPRHHPGRFVRAMTPKEARNPADDLRHRP